MNIPFSPSPPSQYSPPIERVQAPTTMKPTLTSLNARIDEHSERLEKHEERLNKYDAIITRMDVLIDVLTRHVEQISQRTESAIDGQGVLRERNEGIHRYATIGWAVLTSIISGGIFYLIGHFVK